MANPEHLEILYQGVEAWNRLRLKDTNPDLSGAALILHELNGINFSGTNLNGADLSHANFVNANFAYAELKGATFTHATFRVASFTGANLSGANLSHALIALANFNEAQLIEADLSHVSLWGAVFGDNDLSQVRGLEYIRHFAPSTIGIDTIYKSRGNIPEKFLRGCGVPEDFITYMRSLTGKAIEFYSCFISYSSKDQESAKRLYADKARA
jgi:uncharacterized protein YjbI with pentapeptide repeats